MNEKKINTDTLNPFDFELRRRKKALNFKTVYKSETLSLFKNELTGVVRVNEEDLTLYMNFQQELFEISDHITFKLTDLLAVKENGPAPETNLIPGSLSVTSEMETPTQRGRQQSVQVNNPDLSYGLTVWFGDAEP